MSKKHPIEVRVLGNTEMDMNKAINALKGKINRAGVFRIAKVKQTAESKGQKRRRKQKEAVSRKMKIERRSTNRQRKYNNRNK